MEQMWRTPHVLVSSLMFTSPFYPFSYVYWGIAEHTGATVYTTSTTNWRTPLTEVVKVMELEIIACCFRVPTVANRSQRQPTEKESLFCAVYTGS